MTDHRSDSDKFVAHPSSKNLMKITGKISNYKKFRKEGIFVFTRNAKSAMEVVAVLASIAGLGCQATATSSNAHSLEEAADYVEFDIAGKKIKGWLWRSPFVDFDSVDIAAEWQGDHYEVFGVCRPGDRTIALYPHCSRARTRHGKNAIRWWLLMLIFFYLSVFVIYYSDTYDLHKTIQYFQSLFEGSWEWTFFGGIFAAITVPAISMTMQWMPFVRVAEKVFETLELPNAKNIDLVKSSRTQKTTKDTAEYGSMYFRY